MCVGRVGSRDWLLLVPQEQAPAMGQEEKMRGRQSARRRPRRKGEQAWADTEEQEGKEKAEGGV